MIIYNINLTCQILIFQYATQNVCRKKVPSANRWKICLDDSMLQAIFQIFLENENPKLSAYVCIMTSNLTYVYARQVRQLNKYGELIATIHGLFSRYARHILDAVTGFYNCLQ